jgi:D-amino-acid dehydrogenase
MKVIVLGSGVVGVTSAWYLAEAGHEVVVLDRQPGPALETSFANAGEISPGYASPWAAPGIPLKALRWLFMRHSPLFIRPTPSPSMLRFAVAMLGNCTASAYAVNKSRMVPLAGYSRDMLRALRAETGIAYDERGSGPSRSSAPRSCSPARRRTWAVLAELGVPHELLDAEGCVRAEPALTRVRRPGHRHRDPRQAAPPLDRDHHPRRQLPASRKAPIRPSAEGRIGARGNRNQRIMTGGQFFSSPTGSNPQFA